MEFSNFTRQRIRLYSLMKASCLLVFMVGVVDACKRMVNLKLIYLKLFKQQSFKGLLIYSFVVDYTTIIELSRDTHEPDLVDEIRSSKSSSDSTFHMCPSTDWCFSNLMHCLSGSSEDNVVWKPKQGRDGSFLGITFSIWT